MLTRSSEAARRWTAEAGNSSPRVRNVYGGESEFTVDPITLADGSAWKCKLNSRLHTISYLFYSDLWTRLHLLTLLAAISRCCPGAAHLEGACDKPLPHTWISYSVNPTCVGASSTLTMLQQKPRSSTATQSSTIYPPPARWLGSLLGVNWW